MPSRKRKLPTRNRAELARQLLGPIRAAAAATSSVVVAFSGGKDSLALMDLCVERFGPANVHPFWMHFIPMSFQLRFLEQCERRWGVTIARVPHWCLPNEIDSGDYRFRSLKSATMRRLTFTDVMNAMRKRFGCEWVATGEKRTDSLKRLVNAHFAPDGVERNRKIIWPLLYWSDKDVYGYLKARNIPLPPDYRTFKQSFFLFHRDSDLLALKERYPADYALVEQVFPLVGEIAARAEFKRAMMKVRAVEMKVAN